MTLLALYPMLTPKSCVNLVESRGFLPRCYANTEKPVHTFRTKANRLSISATSPPSARTAFFLFARIPPLDIPALPTQTSKERVLGSGLQFPPQFPYVITMNK